MNWLNKYEDGGPTDPILPKKKYEPTSMTDYINPKNWFVSNLDEAGTFDQAFSQARNEDMDEFMWYGTRYNTDLKPTAAEKKVEVSTTPKGITNDLLIRQAYKESTFNPNARSPKGYMGLTQIGDDIIKDYLESTGEKKINPYNPTDAIKVQKWAMDNLYNSTFINKPGQSDEVRLAKTLGAYNWGRGNMNKYLTNQKNKGLDIYNSLDWLNELPAETSDYINKILLSKDNAFEERLQKALTTSNIPSLYKKDGGMVYGLGSHVVHGGPRWRDIYAAGGLIKRADGSYSRRGLWDNIRDANSGKEPTDEMLEQEKEIRAAEKKETGGYVTDKYKKVRSTVPRVAYTEPSNMYTGPTTQRGITFEDGGPTGPGTPLTILGRIDNWIDNAGKSAGKAITKAEDAIIDTGIDQVPYVPAAKGFYNLLVEGRPLSATSNLLKIPGGVFADFGLNNVQGSLEELENKYLPHTTDKTLDLAHEGILQKIGLEIADKNLPSIGQAAKQLGITQQEFNNYLLQNKDRILYKGTSYKTLLDELQKKTVNKKADGGHVTDEYKKVRSTVPRVAYTEPSNMYTGPTTQRGITFEDGGPVNPLNEIPKLIVNNPNDPRLQAYRDSSSLYKKTMDILSPKYYNNGDPAWYNFKGTRKEANDFMRKNNIDLDYEYYRTGKFPGKIQPIETGDFGEGMAYPIYKKPVQEVVYEPLTFMQPKGLSNDTEVSPASNPYPTKMVAPTADEIMMPSGQMMSRKAFIKQYGQGTWDKATNKKADGGPTDPSNENFAIRPVTYDTPNKINIPLMGFDLPTIKFSNDQQTPRGRHIFTGYEREGFGLKSSPFVDTELNWGAIPTQKYNYTYLDPETNKIIEESPGGYNAVIKGGFKPEFALGQKSYSKTGKEKLDHKFSISPSVYTELQAGKVANYPWSDSKSNGPFQPNGTYMYVNPGAGLEVARHQDRTGMWPAKLSANVDYNRNMGTTFGLKGEAGREGGPSAELGATYNPNYGLGFNVQTKWNIGDAYEKIRRKKTPPQNTINPRYKNGGKINKNNWLDNL